MSELLRRYEKEHGVFPSGLAQVADVGSGRGTPVDPTLLQDGWGQDFIYTTDPQGGVIVRSRGRHGFLTVYHGAPASWGIAIEQGAVSGGVCAVRAVDCDGSLGSALQRHLHAVSQSRSGGD